MPAESRATPAELLTSLYEASARSASAEGGGADSAWYLQAHASVNAIRRHADVFERYLPFLPAEGAYLDWGCHHAPDACLIRSALGDGVQLHGCDFAEPDSLMRTFHDFAGLDYHRLTSPVSLPYADASFDVVVGGGVLEHTANDSLALQELHRVLKEGGLLVITFVPNRSSYTEFLGRLLNSPATHLRPYGRKELHRLLLHHGFRPERVAYHQMVPSSNVMGLAPRLWWLNGPLERMWPVNRLSTSMMAVSRRHNTM
jgi:SAM-dependent methyltransferase